MTINVMSVRYNTIYHKHIGQLACQQNNYLIKDKQKDINKCYIHYIQFGNISIQ